MMAADFEYYKITTAVPAENWCDIVDTRTGKEILSVYTWNYAQKRGMKKGISANRERTGYVIVLDVPLITGELATLLLVRVFEEKRLARLLD